MSDFKTAWAAAALKMLQRRHGDQRNTPEQPVQPVNSGPEEPKPTPDAENKGVS